MKDGFFIFSLTVQTVLNIVLSEFGAASQDRTGDPQFTKLLLYRLS